jgi:hypothetical protein
MVTPGKGIYVQVCPCGADVSMFVSDGASLHHANGGAVGSFRHITAPSAIPFEVCVHRAAASLLSRRA